MSLEPPRSSADSGQVARPIYSSHVHCIPYEDYQRLMTMFNHLRAENRKLAAELQRLQGELATKGAD